MSYIGKTPTIGNFQVCDAISVVNNQAAYTMQVGGVNVSPESANHMIVSLNGVIQKPTDAYTVSGSTITFAANLVTNDVINFIQILGNVLDLGVPSDGTVTSAKITYPLTTFSSTGIDDNADATAMTITSAEKIGIGETSPLGLVHIKTADSGAGANGDADDLIVENGTSGASAGISILSATNGYGAINFGDSGDDNIGIINYDHPNNAMKFFSNGYEKMNIGSSTTTFNSNGTVTVDADYAGGGTTRPRLKIGAFASNGSNGGIDFSSFNSSGNTVKINYSTARSAGTTAIEFHNPNGSVGGIDTSGSNTSYNTSSDYRLKENVSYDFDATTRLKQLKPARFNFIADPDTTVDGFIAHEAQLIVPEAVTKEKNAVKEDGTPDYQGIDQAKLVPLLVKTIQELEARITQLENA